LTIDEKIRNLDFCDADVIDRIEIGSKKVFDETEKIRQTKYNTLAEGIRQECKILKEFLDYVFGEGTSEECFGEKNSLQLCLQVFEDIIKRKEKQTKEFNELASKYSPQRLER
jgi:hypothetical protein